MTHNRQSAFCALTDQTCKMYYTDGNYHKDRLLEQVTGTFRKSSFPVTHEGDIGFRFFTAKTWTMHYENRNHRKMGDLN